ncbi:MAG: HD domain-containing protein [Kiritimatiellae bacterium]|nr:HD domain-containing protein [Kiritimatiellia bacterium]
MSPATKRRPPQKAALPAIRNSANARVVAVIDIGTTAIRMEIAELYPDGTARPLDALTRPASLGKDSFTLGRLQNSTIEECVGILRQFRQTLNEYGVRDPSSVRAVATSAVREAENRDQFLDRVHVATGIFIQCLEDADLSRLAYIGIADLLDRARVPRPWNKLVVEVGGGSTEILLMQQNHVTFSETYRLGSLRMRETLLTYRAAPQRVRAILTQDIRRTIEEMQTMMPPLRGVRDMIATSSDARFAATRIEPGWDRAEFARLAPGALARLAARIVEQSADDLVRAYGLSYPEAETLGPALLTYSEIVHAFGLRRILVPNISLRTSLEIDLASNFAGTEDFQRQVRHSATALARRFQCDLPHAQQVTDLALRLFEALRPEHGMGSRQKLLLECAGLLHESGKFVNSRSHHKHSYYLVAHSDLFGITREELEIIALVARYHRRSPPSAAHVEYERLARDAKLTVQKLAAILRVADALDRVHSARVRDLDITLDPGRITLTVHGADDLTIERFALREKGDFFMQVYGREIQLNEGKHR